MDLMAAREKDFEVDLEIGMKGNAEDSSKDQTSGAKVQVKAWVAKARGVLIDGSVKGEGGPSSCDNLLNADGASVECVEGKKAVDHAEKKVVKGKRKKSSNKKPPKPPRPPRAPSLDAADLKLIKEISELATLKRARIERMKALKKMKASNSSTTNSNVFAMVFTVLFCLVIGYQGMSSRITSINLRGSPVSTLTPEVGLIAVQYFGNPSTSAFDQNGPGSASSSLVEPISGSDPSEILGRSAG